jgi:hypothetical protein
LISSNLERSSANVEEKKETAVASTAERRPQIGLLERNNFIVSKNTYLSELIVANTAFLC